MWSLIPVCPSQLKLVGVDGLAGGNFSPFVVVSKSFNLVVIK